jgi:hypothetical protein
LVVVLDAAVVALQMPFSFSTSTLDWELAFCGGGGDGDGLSGKGLEKVRTQTAPQNKTSHDREGNADSRFK